MLNRTHRRGEGRGERGRGGGGEEGEKGEEGIQFNI
jgi:hypothetical protein